MPLENTANIPYSEQELAAKIAHAEGQLNAGGDHDFMKKWVTEWKEQKEQLQKLRAAKEAALEVQGQNAPEDKNNIHSNRGGGPPAADRGSKPI